MKTTRTGFTLIEMLTVLAIITILIGLLIPALNMVRHMAKNTQERSQISVVSLGLEAWNQDFGSYPDSNEYPGGSGINASYTGAQKLAEAMVGRDLRGFNKSEDLALATGNYNTENGDYYLANGTYTPDEIKANLERRLNPFLDIERARVYKVSSSRTGEVGLFDRTNPMQLATDSVTICDVFDRLSVTLADGTVVRTGMPLLYFRANPAGTLSNVYDYYDFGDNYAMIQAAQNSAGLTGGFLSNPDPIQAAQEFYRFIQNPRVAGGNSTSTYPYKADSYILISAGYDGIYGTSDDITNFN